MIDYKFENINCVLCGNNNTHLLATKGKFNLPANVVLCKECGLGYLNSRWDSASYMQFYQNEYDKFYRPNLSNKKEDANFQAVNPIVERLKAFNLLPKTIENILDIGSGEGSNLKYFKLLYSKAELYAIEPSVESQKHLKSFQVKVISDNVDSSWEACYSGKFDLIIMRHVLEHFMNPVSVMRKVWEVLSENGILYIAVPNNLNPTQHLKKSWFRNVHTYYFNRFSLKNLSDITGFEIIKLVESDHFNKGEVFFLAKKTKEKLPVFSKEHYHIQLSVFEKKRKSEKNLFNRLNMLTKKASRKISKLLKKKI